jgi:cadmium resistance protein CadD (predicted permease)
MYYIQFQINNKSIKKRNKCIFDQYGTEFLMKRIDDDYLCFYVSVTSASNDDWIGIAVPVIVVLLLLCLVVVIALFIVKKKKGR